MPSVRRIAPKSEELVYLYTSFALTGIPAMLLTNEQHGLEHIHVRRLSGGGPVNIFRAQRTPSDPPFRNTHLIGMDECSKRRNINTGPLFDVVKEADGTGFENFGWNNPCPLLLCSNASAYSACMPSGSVIARGWFVHRRSLDLLLRAFLASGGGKLRHNLIAIPYPTM
jgi:hypothetical protein